MERIGILYSLTSKEVHPFLAFLEKNKIVSEDVGGPDNFAEYSLTYSNGKTASTIKRTSDDFSEMVVPINSRLEQLVKQYQKK